MKLKRFGKIYVEITNCCNLACSFCAISHRKPEFMCVENFELIADKIKDYTNLIYLHVKGEPLLHPQLAEILTICEQKKLLVTITTNSTLLKQNQNTILEKQHTIRQMNLSLHSIEENVHTKAYNEQTYMQEVIEAVRNITKNTNILISYRLWNLRDYKQNAHNQKILNALGEEYKIDHLVNLAKEHQWVKLAPYVYLNQDKQFTWPSLDLPPVGCEGKCFGLRNQIAILVNGDVVPCCLDQDGDILLGNLYKQDLEEILNTDKAKKIKQGFENHKLIEPLCQTCGFIRKREERGK